LTDESEGRLSELDGAAASVWHGRLEALEGRLSALDGNMNSLKRIAVDVASARKRENDGLAEKADALAKNNEELASQVESLIAQVEALRTELVSATARAGRLKGENEWLRATRSEISSIQDASKNELKNLKERLAISETTIATLKGSTSWKITAPVRAIRSILR
jgi:chromosome segregation ATPase